MYGYTDKSMCKGSESPNGVQPSIVKIILFVIVYVSIIVIIKWVFLTGQVI